VKHHAMPRRDALTQLLDPLSNSTYRSDYRGTVTAAACTQFASPGLACWPGLSLMISPWHIP